MIWLGDVNFPEVKHSEGSIIMDSWEFNGTPRILNTNAILNRNPAIKQLLRLSDEFFSAWKWPRKDCVAVVSSFSCIYIYDTRILTIWELKLVYHFATYLMIMLKKKTPLVNGLFFFIVLFKPSHELDKCGVYIIMAFFFLFSSQTRQWCLDLSWVEWVRLVWQCHLRQVYLEPMQVVQWWPCRICLECPICTACRRLVVKLFHRDDYL